MNIRSRPLEQEFIVLNTAANYKGERVKIVSWNVNGIRACGKKGLIEFVATEKPDILCLQETKAHFEQVEPDLRSLGYKNHLWCSAVRKGYSGVAIFSNQENPQYISGMGIDDYDNEGRVVRIKLSDFELYNIYFPNGGSGEERHNFKQKFLQELNDHLKPKIKAGEKIIVVGDYNVARDDIDVYDPIRLSGSSGFLPEERTWFDSFIDMGMVDSFRHFFPEKTKEFSWWSYRELARAQNRGWRIDYVCTTKNLVPKYKAAGIMQNQEGSDHCPVWLELK